MEEVKRCDVADCTDVGCNDLDDSDDGASAGYGYQNASVVKTNDASV